MKYKKSEVLKEITIYNSKEELREKEEELRNFK
jgi:hypothetical protein